LSEVGANVPGLNVPEVNVPVMVALPATFKFPPSVSPNAEILFPEPVEDKSAGSITSGYVIVPSI
jgi:hypothetical protein